VWVHSSSKHRRDETGRADRIERARLGLDRLNERLQGPRTRIKTRVAASEAADAIVAALGCERYLACTVNEHTETTMRQATAGRPGPDTKYVKTTRTTFQVDVEINDDAVRHDASSDGCFPLISNDHDLTDTEVFAAYRYQPNLEKRHHELKSVQDAAPVTLHSAARIEALFACQFIALLCRCLIERELRQAMTRNDIKDLPLYHEDRSCTAPTAARVFDTFSDTRRHQLTRDGTPIQTFQPDLTALQRQLLTLLNVSEHAYTGAP
jgi:transposase